MKNWNHWIFPWPHHNPAIYWAITRPSFNNPYMNQSNEGTPPPPLITFKIRFPSLNHLDDLCFTAWTSTFWDICGMKGKRYGKKGGCVFFFPVGVMWVVFCFRSLCGRDTLLEKDDLEVPESTRSFQKSGKSSWDRVIHEKCIDLLLSLYPTNDKQPFPCLLLQRFPETWRLPLIMGDVHFICWVAGWVVWSQSKGIEPKNIEMMISIWISW